MRKFNAEMLYRVECFEVFFKNSPFGEGKDFENWIFGLSDKGHKFRAELAEDLEKIELRRQEVKALLGANTRSTVAMWVSFICALISVPAFLDWFFKLLTSFFN
jgi:hypothetical protein